MIRPDPTASTALGAQIIRPVFFCYLDVLGDPLRACTAGKSYTLVSTGDPDLDAGAGASGGPDDLAGTRW